MSKKLYIAFAIFLTVFVFSTAMFSFSNYGFDMIVSALLTSLVSLVATLLAMSFIDIE
jgi:hypothetical protein